MYRIVPFALVSRGTSHRLRKGIAFSKASCCRLSVKATVHSLDYPLVHSCSPDGIPFSKTDINDTKLEPFRPFRVCKYKGMTCKDSGIKMQRRYLYTHQATNCPSRTECEHCGEDIIACLEVMHKYQQCKNFHDKQEEEELIKGGKNRKYQTDLQKKEDLMKTKTANAATSLHIAANYLDKKWKESINKQFAFTWRGFAFTSVGAIIESMLHFPTTASIIWMFSIVFVINYPKLGKDAGEAIYSLVSSEIPTAEKHLNEAEHAVKEVKDTIQFWKKSPTLAGKLCKIHEDILRQADHVPISKRQAGVNDARSMIASFLGGDVHYSIRDTVTNWGVGEARILREKADELNKFTELQIQ